MRRVGLKHLASKSDKSMRPKLHSLDCHMKCDFYSAIISTSSFTGFNYILHVHSYTYHKLIYTFTYICWNVKFFVLPWVSRTWGSSSSWSETDLSMDVTATCYACGTRWALDHAVSAVALEHYLTTILDFPATCVGHLWSSCIHSQTLAPIL